MQLFYRHDDVNYLDRRLLESQLAAGLPVVLVGHHVFGDHLVQPEVAVGHGFHVHAFALGRPLQLVDITVSDRRRYITTRDRIKSPECAPTIHRGS